MAPFFFEVTMLFIVLVMGTALSSLGVLPSMHACAFGLVGHIGHGVAVALGLSMIAGSFRRD